MPGFTVLALREMQNIGSNVARTYKRKVGETKASLVLNVLIIKKYQVHARIVMLSFAPYRI